MLKLIKTKNQGGVTLLETILVLSLIAIIMVGGLNLYRNASDSAKANDARRQVVALATNVRSLYQSTSTYTNLDVQDLIDSGAVPIDLVNANEDDLINAFGGDVNVIAVAGTGATDSHFEIEYPDVSKTACYKIVTGDTGAAIIGISSGCTTSTKDDGSATDCVLGAVNPSSASTFCPNDTGNDLFFTFN